MKQFQSIEKLDAGILYMLELASSLSVLLLAFGLIASMANVLTKGSVLSDNPIMQRIWAWTQCIAIGYSVAGTIIWTFRYKASPPLSNSCMKFLLGANVEYRTARFLSSLGHDVKTIARNYPHSLTDQKVLALETEEERILLTNDRDFGALASLTFANICPIAVSTISGSRTQKTFQKSSSGYKPC